MRAKNFEEGFDLEKLSDLSPEGIDEAKAFADFMRQQNRTRRRGHHRMRGSVEQVTRAVYTDFEEIDDMAPNDLGEIIVPRLASE